MFYAFIKNNEFIGAGECPQETTNVINVEITKEIFENIDRYVWNGNSMIEDINYETKEKSKNVRELRNYLLQSTDKYMLSDYPITEEQREQYKQYRQYLRDVPSSDNFPDIEIKNFENWQREK